MWLLHPPKSRRRWHVFTWLAALPALVFVALVQVAGVYDSGENRLIQAAPLWYYTPNPDAGYPRDMGGDPPDFDADIDAQYNRLPEYVAGYQHGWPLPWLQRELGFGAGHWRLPFRLWSRLPDPGEAPLTDWPIDADAWQVAPAGLAVNLLVALAVVALPMLATETWLRRRGGLGRFKIIDFLVVVAVVAAGFGFWRWDRAAVEQERRLAGQISALKGLADEILQTSYVGPEWIERLMGRGKVPIFQRHIHLRANASDFSHLDCKALALFPHLKSVEISCDFFETAPNDFRLADLAKLAQVRELTLHVPSNNPLIIFFSSGDASQLTQINSLTIHGDNVSPATLLPARQLPNLRELRLRTDWFYEEELADLERSFQGIKIIPLGDTRLPPYRREQIAVRRWGLGCELSNDAQTLVLDSSSSLSAERLRTIERILPRLEQLTVEAPHIDGDACDYFRQMTALEVLTLKLDQWPERFADSIAPLPKLRRLHIERHKPPLEALLPLQGNPNLTLSFSRLAWNVGGDQDLYREAFGERIEVGSP